MKKSNAMKEKKHIFVNSRVILVIMYSVKVHALKFIPPNNMIGFWIEIVVTKWAI